MKAAQRAVGKRVAKAAAAAGAKGAPRMMGRKLRVSSRVHARTRGAEVELFGTPAGAWTIADTGARAHPIKARKAEALTLGAARFAAHVAHPGVGGRRAWTIAGARMEPVIADTIADVYDKALT